MGRDYVANETPVPTGTLSELFLETVRRFRDATTFQAFEGSGLRDYTGAETLERVRQAAAGLATVGLARGDRAAILSENRPEWAFADFACICAGIADVPIYATLTPQQVSYILQDSGSRLAFVSTREQLDKVMEVRDECPELEHVVVFDGVDDGAPEGVVAWESFLARGREDLPDEEAFRTEATRAAPGDLVTILYTSGTTGDPKGVMLTHNNLFSNVHACTHALEVGPRDVTLSFLPLSHVFQRMVDYLLFMRGCTIAYARSLQTVPEDLRTVRPTLAVSVPRLYEKVYQKVMEKDGVQKVLVDWAARVAEAWTDAELEGGGAGPLLALQHRLADTLVYRKVRAGVGGRLNFFVSGGAPLPPDIARFFYGAGLRILEGYGLTETSPVTNVNTVQELRIGTVGKPVASTEIRIAGDGEIQVRGPQVMKGYYRLAEATAEAITPEGWFRTGDVGEIDDDGFLRITDRIKDLIVTSGGKNVAPQPIENRVRTNPYVDQAVMVGNRRNFPALLVVPSFERLEAWAREAGVPHTDRRTLLEDERTQELMRREVLGALDGLASYERPKKMALLQEEFTIEGGALTPTQKVKRRVVEERYAPVIDALYDEENYDRTVLVG